MTVLSPYLSKDCKLLVLKVNYSVLIMVSVPPDSVLKLARTIFCLKMIATNQDGPYKKYNTRSIVFADFEYMLFARSYLNTFIIMCK